MSKFKKGFAFGGIVALVGFVLRIFAERLARDYRSPNAWTTDRFSYEMWEQISLVLLIFGLALVVVAFNVWLQSGHRKEMDIRPQ